jgi:FkbM family methyltransferase
MLYQQTTFWLSSRHDSEDSSPKTPPTIMLSKFELLKRQDTLEQEAYCKQLRKDGPTTIEAKRFKVLATTEVTVQGVDNNRTFQMHVFSKNDLVSNEIIATGRWDQTKLNTFVKVMHAYSKQYHIPLHNLTFVDIGANIGWFTFQLASLGVNVIAIEPFAANVQVMRQTLCRNPHWAERITILRTGLSSSNHSCVLYSKFNNVGDGNMDCSFGDPTKFVPPVGYVVQAIIPCQRMDDLLLPQVMASQSHDNNNHPTQNVHRQQPSQLYIAAVKMDVEAHEPQVILGGLHFFTKSGIPFFYMEFDPRLIRHRNKGDAVSMLQTFCDARCTIRRESLAVPWNCANEALDPATWKDEPMMDLIIECPSGDDRALLKLPFLNISSKIRKR